MGAEWTSLTLREAGVELLDCVHKTPPSASSGYPYVAIPQMKNGHIALAGVRRISRDDFRKWTSKTKPRAWDVVVSRRCNPGETALVPPGLECALGQNLVLLRSDGTDIFPPFLRWLLRSPTWWEQVGKFINVGAVFDSLKCADIPNFSLLIPPLPEQKAIAHILGSLDDKIEVNRRMNETLEAIAGAIFKSWFVDFDPVRAKAEGRQPEGLDAETAALFPGSFEDSELGKIPRGWKCSPLSEHIKPLRGLSYKGKFLSEYGFPLHNLNSIYEGGGYKDSGIKHYLGEYKDRHVVHPGDLIVANTEQGFDHLLIGYPAIVPRRLGEQGLFTHHLYRLEIDASSPTTSDFLYHLLLSHRLRSLVIGFTNGTTVNALPIDGLQMPSFVLPCDELILLFDQVARSFRDRAEQNTTENHDLGQTRDALLPKLLSGELRVKDAEKFIEGAA